MYGSSFVLGRMVIRSVGAGVVTKSGAVALEIGISIGQVAAPTADGSSSSLGGDEKNVRWMLDAICGRTNPAMYLTPPTL